MHVVGLECQRSDGLFESSGIRMHVLLPFMATHHATSTHNQLTLL